MLVVILITSIAEGRRILFLEQCPFSAFESSALIYLFPSRFYYLFCFLARTEFEEEIYGVSQSKHCGPSSEGSNVQTQVFKNQ